MDYKGYSGRVEFDQTAGVLFGEVEGLRDVVTFEATNVDELQVAFKQSVDDYLAMCSKRGEQPEKPYSGKFLLRLNPTVHREIAMAAARAGQSLNNFAASLFKSWVEGSRPPNDQPAVPAASVRPVLEFDSKSVRWSPAHGDLASGGSRIFQPSGGTTPASNTPDTPSSRTPNSRHSSN